MTSGVATLIFGLIFAAVGFGVMCIGIFKPPGTVVENAGIALVAGLIFGVIGLIVLGRGVLDLVRYLTAIKNGTRYAAKVWKHDLDYSIRINDHPAILLVVRYFDNNGRLHEESLSTGTTNQHKFPLGQTVRVVEYEDRVYLLTKKAEPVRVDREEELLSAAAVPEVSITTVIVERTAASTARTDNAMVKIAGALTGMDEDQVRMRANANGYVFQGQQAPAYTAGGGYAGAGPSSPAIEVACPSCGSVMAVLPGTKVQCSCGRQFSLTQDHMIV
ncbi:MAG: hypothetical protein K6E50_15635 [Lachnospiraceae bacterium]|nr:hypothetical protein [Lachnospiraceae bacterium]